MSELEKKRLYKKATTLLNRAIEILDHVHKGCVKKQEVKKAA